MLFQPPDPAAVAPPTAVAGPAQGDPAAAGREPPTDAPAVAPHPRPSAEALPPAAEADTASGTPDSPPGRRRTPAASGRRAPAARADAEAVGKPVPKAADRATARTAPPAERATPTAKTAAGPTEENRAEEAIRAKKASSARKAAPKKSATREKSAAPEKKATAARKTTGVRKTAPARKTAAADPGPERPQVTMTMAEEASARTPEAGWRAVAARVADHPGFAPELLALAAVDALGSAARDRVEQLRRTYPGADADGLARLVTRRFVRLAGTAGAFAVGAGLLAPVAELAAALWAQASLVLHLAAVHGRDPGHPDRAAELLVLTQVHPDIDTARAALDAVRSAGAPADGPWPRAVEAAWRLATPLAAQAGAWLMLRLASRLLPGAALLAAVAGDSAAAERLAARAGALYRPTRPR
ncbi:hypothetical protein ABZ570_13570 [Micromonospora sp. NPDC007271]|uniref:hypothetical protein n=1 Tax=Micromonospora sp. NPDC007271 TaxID=3154587 RepID=UPI0033C5702D